MQASRPRRLPAPLKRVLALLPAQPGSWLFSGALNTLLAKHLDADTRAALAARRLRLRVADAGLCFDFHWRGHAFAALPPGQDADLSISATLNDLALLAARKEDPDTLFFSRRLVMEGDTELGLRIKNLLDALDVPPFDPAQLAPGRVWQRLRPRPAK